MSFLQSIKKQYVKSVMKNDFRFKYDRNQQQLIIDKFPEPENYYDRSFYQFKCQFSMLGKQKYLYQFASLFLLIYRILCTPRIVKNEHTVDLVCMSRKGRDRVPKELLGEYDNYVFEYSLENYLIRKGDLKWFASNIVCKYPLYPFFWFKVFLRMTQYSYLLAAYKPKAIAAFCEYSCSSSAMTEYCHRNGVQHYNYMHGEKIWYIRDSYFQFDRCYVWNEYYIDIFKSLKAFPEQFIVSVPEEFLISNVNIEYNKAYYDYCYYLANENESELNTIFSNMSKLVSKGFLVSVRIHPTWTNVALVDKLASEWGIEVEAKGIPINDSILNTRNAISLFSTVLLQAHLLKRDIVIDDLVSPHKYEMLKAYNYIAFELRHRLLSGCIEDAITIGEI